MSEHLHPGAGAPLVRLVIAYGIALPLAFALTPAGWPWEVVAAACLVALSGILRLAPWWLLINALFLPALGWCLTLQASPLWALAALAALLLMYGRIWVSRVPLFFTSARAQQALAAVLPHDRPLAFFDAGCGDARVLAGLAAGRPESRFEGIEHALVPWLMAWLHCWKHDAQVYVRRGDLWSHGLAQYDVVYAYLSPAVMARFWEKARREMRPGSILISAFAVPGMAHGRRVEVGDRMGTCLHVIDMHPQGAAA